MSNVVVDANVDFVAKSQRKRCSLSLVHDLIKNLLNIRLIVPLRVISWGIILLSAQSGQLCSILGNGSTLSLQI